MSCRHVLPAVPDSEPPTQIHNTFLSLGISQENAEERAQAKHLFELLDRDDDERLEFCDTMLFIFSMDEEREGDM